MNSFTKTHCLPDLGVSGALVRAFTLPKDRSNMTFCDYATRLTIGGGLSLLLTASLVLGFTVSIVPILMSSAGFSSATVTMMSTVVAGASIQTLAILASVMAGLIVGIQLFAKLGLRSDQRYDLT
jgi:hypothetical protein